MINQMPKLKSQFETPDDSPGFMLWRVSNLWQRHIRAALEPLGLTHVQFVLLASLAWLTKEGHALTQVQLANHTGIDVMMTSQVVRTLQTKGLLLRNPKPTDSRAFELMPTARGLEFATEAMQVVEQADQAFFAQLSQPKAFVKGLQELFR